MLEAVLWAEMRATEIWYAQGHGLETSAAIVTSWRYSATFLEGCCLCFRNVYAQHCCSKKTRREYDKHVGLRINTTRKLRNRILVTWHFGGGKSDAPLQQENRDS